MRPQAGRAGKRPRATRVPKLEQNKTEPALYRSNPAPTGAFYFFNHAQSIKNVLQYLAPLPTTTPDIELLFLPK